LVIDPSEDRVETGGRMLLVDDRPESRAVIRTPVQTGAGAGTVVAEAASVAAALTVLRADTTEAVVVEIQMPVSVRLAVIATLPVEQPALVIVVCSFHADTATRQEASAAGAYLTKPVSPRDLLGACALPRRASAESSDDILSGPDSDSSSGLDLSADHRLVTQGSPP
jgi:CheY-like chemotaxis protein